MNHRYKVNNPCHRNCQINNKELNRLGQQNYKHKNTKETSILTTADLATRR